MRQNSTSSRLPTQKKPLLSIIIPFRINGNVDVEERLRWKSINKNVDVIVVDDGSEEGHSISKLCDERGWRYFKIDSKNEIFSLSRARNLGIREALADYIYFEDIDFLHKRDFYDRLSSFTAVLESSPFNFASIPTLFLNKRASDELIASLAKPRLFETIFDKLIFELPLIDPDGDNNICASFAPVGSNILVKRDTCFHVGLFDEYFSGWGGEDRDFIFRLLHHNSMLIRPDDFGATRKWKIHRTNAYEGWRSIYRLHGEWLMKAGLYAVHIFHPDNQWKEPERRAKNFQYAEDRAKAIVAGKQKIVPELIDRAGSPVVFIGRNPVFYNDEVMRVLGNVVVVEQDKRLTPEQIADQVKRHNPSSVFFQNPYGNNWLLSIWNILKNYGIRCVCAERGALPWSIYFDDDGFCSASGAYKKVRWENSAPIDARAYLKNIRKAGDSLEPQGQKSAEGIKPRIDVGKKTILVILQSVRDATTLHFSAPMSSYEHFCEEIKTLIAGGEFNVLIKNHPLNKIHPLPGEGIDVSDYPLYELFDISDAVLTLNSGVGVHAIGLGLPTITLGTAFYAESGLAIAAGSASEVAEIVKSDVKPDQDAVDRFFGYLVNEFYSFARWTYGSRDQSELTRLSTMANIRYERIVWDGKPHEVTRKSMNMYSLLLDPYAYYLFLKKKKPKPVTEPKPIAKAETAGGAKEPVALLSKTKPDSRTPAAMALSSARSGDKAFAAGDFDGAAKAYDAAFELNRDNSSYLRKAAEAYVRLGDMDAAIERLAMAIKIDPYNPNITRRIREIRRPKFLRSVLKEKPFPIASASTAN